MAVRTSQPVRSDLQDPLTHTPKSTKHVRFDLKLPTLPSPAIVRIPTPMPTERYEMLSAAAERVVRFTQPTVPNLGKSAAEQEKEMYLNGLAIV